MAADLVEIDEAEEGTSFGQAVQKAFPLADFFLNVVEGGEEREKLSRFVHLFFGDHFITPTRDEFCQHQASTVAKRSADLSRQVGAVLANDQGQIIAVGCNDTPKAGGGMYWNDGDGLDRRDFSYLGFDPSEAAKSELLGDLFARLKKRYR